VSFGEEKRGAFLEEKEGALHEGLSKTLESLRRSSCVGLSLHGEYFHGAIASISEREHFHGGGAHLGEEGAFIILHLLIRRGGLVRLR
jgi:hypothetical protein